MKRNICPVCGHPGTEEDPVVMVKDQDGPYRRHRSGRDRGRCDATLRR